MWILHNNIISERERQKMKVTRYEMNIRTKDKIHWICFFLLSFVSFFLFLHTGRMDECGAQSNSYGAHTHTHTQREMKFKKISSIKKDKKILYWNNEIPFRVICWISFFLFTFITKKKSHFAFEKSIDCIFRYSSNSKFDSDSWWSWW